MSDRTSNKGGGAEGVLLVLILLAVGGMAMAASFTHVHDFTMRHSPVGTPGWFGWANSVISELTPTASLLELRRRTRLGGSVRFPLWVLIGSTAVSLTANLAQAVPSIYGWLVAGLPAVAFAVLTKMVLSRRPAAEPVQVADQAIEPVQAAEPAPEPVQVAQPAAEPEPVAEPAPEPVAEPLFREPMQRREPARRPSLAHRVVEAHRAEPAATNERIAELAGCSLATVKRHRPSRRALVAVS